MEGIGGRTLLSPRWLLVPALAVAIVVLMLAWPKSEQESARAASGGPEMALTVKSGDVPCPQGKDPSHVCVPGGDLFTLSVEVITAPANGYIQLNSFLDFGSDITYELPKPTAATEIVWPDLEPATALRGQPGTGLVNHGGLTALLPPQPTSTFTGNVVEVVLRCSTDSTTTDVKLLPEGDPVAGPFGALFVEPDGVTQVTPKVSGVTINCLGPTPSPTNTLPPESPTPTISPTPTDTPTPTPLPSERPDVSVTKVDLTDPVDSAANYTYRVTVTSVGLQTAVGVKVVDTLPPGTTFVSATSAGANCTHDSGVVTCQIKADMNPSDEVIIDIVVTAPSPSTDDRISNSVSVTSTNEPFANTGNNKDKEETVILAPRADVTVEKSGEPTFAEGNQNVTYTIVARNLGPNKADNVEVSDILPADTDATFVSSTNPECGNPIGGKVLCQFGTIQPGGQEIVEITLTALPVTRDTLLKNVAMISADNELFSQTGNNTAVENTPVVAPPPDLVITKTDSADPILRLDFFSYTITVDNQGDGDALDVVISDVLPKVTVQKVIPQVNATTLISVKGAACQELGDNKVECTFDEILAHDTVQFTLNVRAPTIIDDDKLTNTVTGSVLNPDEDPAGNQDTETTQLKACFDISGDLLVSLQDDILPITANFMLNENSPGWDVIYDFDGDGFVSLQNDILKVLQHFMQNCALLL